MLTFNNTNLKQSLWRTADGGATWDRVLCSSVSGFDSLNLIRPVPQYSAGSPVIIIAGQANGNPVIWISADNGQNITGRTAPCNIDTLAIVDSSTWFLSGYDGSKGQVYQTADGGNTYTLPTETGLQPLAAIALSPSYGQDKTILAGNIVGQVFISQDNGANFQLSFLSQPGFTHAVQYRTDLISGNWQTYSNVIGDGTLKIIPIPLSVFGSAPQGFIRVSTQ